MSATTMIYFDTLRYVKTLKAAGLAEKQAEAFAEAQQEALSECLDTTLATKADLYEVKAELKLDIKTLESRVSVLSWMMGFLLAGVGSLVLKTFF